MKKLSRLFSLIFALFLALSITGCGGSQILNLTAFNTTIRIEAHDKKISNQTKLELEKLFTNLEKDFDKKQTTSITYKLNGATANAKIALTSTQKEALELSKSYFNFSNRRFNPAVYPLVKLWGFDDFGLVVDFNPPQEDKIREILNKNLTDYNQVVLENGFVYKTNPDLQIDLGGLVKGYAVDKALEIMLNAGHNSGYINVGNSSMALLGVESLNVSHPRKSGQSILNINAKNLKNTTLSTSGDYQRFFEFNGKRYSHIIHPLTGYPIETGIASATVIGGTGAFTDAVTTALCACDRQTELIPLMEKIISEYPDCHIYIVYDKDKEIITNKNSGVDFTRIDNDYEIVKI